MRGYRILIAGLLSVLFLASCSSTDSQQTVYSPGSGAGATEEREQTLEPSMEEQRALAEERERQRMEAQREAEAQRVAEAEVAARRAEEQRLAAEREQREAEEVARREAQRQRELVARRAQEQARIVAAQQERIDALRAQIAANEEETENVESANAILRQAIVAAEELNQALSAEEEKYNNADESTGELGDELNTARLEELTSEVESLSNQAQSLMAQP